ncbi:Translation initiation factor IF-2 [Paramicrosporidium saccamoebae]|uniref:Translation initiation factor IF-2 n=1 Tax=Paramicrosporidium saccamoebae TaxID=1246581 RepID=A0A2H9TPX2_9FUNG|nr:Translation initiation factor IF-2 [Paramicrosporidium saccamoebae]
MGHVDHGKTTLLDYLRKSAVAAGEAGGITQHIGAFSVDVSANNSGSDIKRITFLDTPGHAAFSRIRERGANVTDIVVLVVAADDGVMAQTIESIKYAQAAEVPLVVAINKCDKCGPDRITKVKEELLKHNVVCEDFGGDTQAVPVSGLNGLNMSDLLESLMLQGELLELRADPEGPMEGAIVESQVRMGLGDCATVLVQSGTLRPGAMIVAEDSICRVRAMRDYSGKLLKEAPPSHPVEVAGWKSLPRVGATVIQVQSESEALEISNSFLDKKEEVNRRLRERILKERENIHKKMWEVKTKSLAKDSTVPMRAVMSYEEFDKNLDTRPTLNIVVKSDVIGSQEAVAKVLDEIKSSKASIKVCSNTVGPLTETDLNNASTMDVQHSEKRIGEATVLQLFSFEKSEHIAGCRVDDGQLLRSREKLGDVDRHFVQLVRNEKVIWTGRIATMRHVKKEISSAGKGMECGILLEECTSVCYKSHNYMMPEVNSGHSTRLTTKTAASLLNRTDTILFDCDGVIWRGNQVIPNALPTLNHLRSLGKRLFFVTNNSTKSRATMKDKFAALGLDEDDGAIFDFNHEIPSRNVGAVVVGFDAMFNYTKLAKAQHYLTDPNCLFLVTNTDNAFPDVKQILPGTGCIVAAVQTASKREPIVIGKPSPHAFAALQAVHPEIDPTRTLMVGDRIETDIFFGRECGMLTLLVESGINKESDLVNFPSDKAPDYIATDISALFVKS